LVVECRAVGHVGETRGWVFAGLWGMSEGVRAARKGFKMKRTAAMSFTLTIDALRVKCFVFVRMGFEADYCARERVVVTALAGLEYHPGH
jgi:hypothetical protein